VVVVVVVVVVAAVVVLRDVRVVVAGMARAAEVAVGRKWDGACWMV